MIKAMVNKTKSIFKKKWFWIVVTIIVLGLGGYLIFGRKSDTLANSDVVKRGDVREELIISGQVEAEKYVALAFPTSGKIASVYTKEGIQVKKGQYLTALDTTSLNAAYEQALNSYKNYQATAENVLDTVKDHSGDETFAQKATRTTAETARDSAYDAVTAARYNLDNAIIKAPFTGIVSSLPFSSPGVNIAVGQTAVEILDPESIYFEVQADQNEVTDIKLNQEVVIKLDSFKDKEIRGIVSYISYTPLEGQASTIYKVKVNLNKENMEGIDLRVGMSGDAKFTLSKKENVLYIPVDYLHSDKNGKYVFVGKSGNRVKVEIGVENEETVEVISGVKEGDIVFE